MEHQMDLQQDHIKCKRLDSCFNFQFEQLLSLWAACGMVQRFFKLFRSAFIGIGPLSSLEKIYSFHAGHFLLDKEVKKQICMSSLVHGEQGVFVPAVGSQAGLKREPHWFPAAPSECLLAKGVYCWESPSGFVVWDVQSWHLSSFTVFCGVTNLRRGQRTLGPSAAVESLQQDTALGKAGSDSLWKQKEEFGEDEALQTSSFNFCREEMGKKPCSCSVPAFYRMFNCGTAPALLLIALGKRSPGMCQSCGPTPFIPNWKLWKAPRGTASNNF